MSAVFEMAGVWSTGSDTEIGKWVQVAEIGKDRVQVHVNKGYDPPLALLTVDEARTLARQLYRMARRVEARQALKEAT